MFSSINWKARLALVSGLALAACVEETPCEVLRTCELDEVPDAGPPTQPSTPASRDDEESDDADDLQPTEPKPTRPADGPNDAADAAPSTTATEPTSSGPSVSESLGRLPTELPMPDASAAEGTPSEPANDCDGGTCESVCVGDDCSQCVSCTSESGDASTPDSDPEPPAPECAENEVQTCGSSVGNCETGTRECIDGQWGDCLGGIEPEAADSCDVLGDDANCNGSENDNCPCTTGDTRPCGSDVGNCSVGTQSCNDGVWSTTCTGGVTPAPQDSCAVEGDDADCNGVPNEVCQCMAGTSECVPGTPSTQKRTCSTSGAWGTPTTCPYVCSGAGACTGVCIPGTRECGAGGTPRQCDDTGQWQSETACGSTTPCQGAGQCQSCPAGSYASAGSCVPWTECQPGQVVTVAGTPTSNRQCGSCPAGTFSATSNVNTCTTCTLGTYSSAGAASCTAWTTCDAGVGLVEATPGSTTSDRTCEPFPSCDGVVSNCGASGNDSCCASPLVTGGTYNRRNDPNYPATVSDFRLDKYEVTVGRFRKFVEAYQGPPSAGAGGHPRIPGTGWQTSWNSSMANNSSAITSALQCDSFAPTWDTSGTNDRLAIACVTWFEAFAFCAWDGGWLPTQTEWNYAASGGSAQREYAWGDTAPGANTDLAIYKCYYNEDGGCDLTNVAPVGSVPAGNGLFQQSDLGGSVWEWNMDWYLGTLPMPCTDCMQFDDVAGSRVVVSGSWYNLATPLHTDYYLSNTPTSRSSLAGMRCARSR